MPWMATGAVPVRIRTAISLFAENSHPEMRHLGVMFRSPQAFVWSMVTLPYEPCTQFINVSQRALHIYELTAVECVRWTHGIKIERNNLLCEQAPTEVFRSIFAWLVAMLLPKLLFLAVLGVLLPGLSLSAFRCLLHCIQGITSQRIELL